MWYLLSRQTCQGYAFSYDVYCKLIPSLCRSTFFFNLLGLKSCSVNYLTLYLQVLLSLSIALRIGRSLNNGVVRRIGLFVVMFLFPTFFFRQKTSQPAGRIATLGRNHVEQCLCWWLRYIFFVVVVFSHFFEPTFKNSSRSHWNFFQTHSSQGGRMRKIEKRENLPHHYRLKLNCNKDSTSESWIIRDFVDGTQGIF